jgi:hypothetical protein
MTTYLTATRFTRCDVRSSCVRWFALAPVGRWLPARQITGGCYSHIARFLEDSENCILVYPHQDYVCCPTLPSSLTTQHCLKLRCAQAGHGRHCYVTGRLLTYPRESSLSTPNCCARRVHGVCWATLNCWRKRPSLTLVCLVTPLVVEPLEYYASYH